MIRVDTLSNGLRVATERMAQRRTITLTPISLHQEKH